MTPAPRKALRCAIYTRKSTEHGLEQEFNSLDNQREAAEAYVKSQAHEGWRGLRERYDDGGFSGGSMERPALQRLRPRRHRQPALGAVRRRVGAHRDRAAPCARRGTPGRRRRHRA